MTQLLVAGFCCMALLFASFSSEETPEQIAPDHAMIDATFLSFFQKDNTDWALLKINAVSGFGAGFRGALSANDTIEAKLPKGHSYASGSAFSGQIRQGLGGLSNTAPTTYEINN